MEIMLGLALIAITNIIKGIAWLAVRAYHALTKKV